MPNKLTGYVVNHGHMDIEWYMPLRSYRFWTVEALDLLRQIAKEHPDYTTYVLDGVTYVLDIYLAARPEAREEMRQLICDGKLTIGPFFTQFDEWLPSAESMVRNCLYGNRACREYGKIMKAGYLPDNFGHPLQLPQILNNFGIDSLLFMRGMPEVPGGHPDEFLYTGLDGSQVLVSHFRDSYGGAYNIFGKPVDPMQPRDVPYYSGYLSYEYYMELADHTDPDKIARELIQNVLNIHERYPSGVIPLIAGCDHCPPQAKMAETLALANQMQDQVQFVMGDAEGYVRMVQANLHEPMQYQQELIGSFYQYILLGALSTRSYLKRQNFAAEALMERYTEPLDACAALLGYSGAQPQIDEAWKNLMVNSTHDSIHGSSMDEVHIEMEARFAAVRQIAAGLIHDALKHIGRHMRPWWQTKGFGPDRVRPDRVRGLLTFTPANPGVPQLGQVWLPTGDQAVQIFDESGSPLPTQVMPREEIPLNSIGKPRNSYWPDPKLRNVLFLAPSEANQVNSYVCAPEVQVFDAIDASPSHLENNYLRVEVHGALIDLLDKETGVWHYGLNLLVEDADAGDAWDYSPPWTPAEVVLSNRFAFASRLVETGPVRAAIETSGKLSVPYQLVGDQRSPERVDIPVRFRISLERFARRVDVKLTFDNQARDHRLRLRVPTGLKTNTILSQGQFGVIERPIQRVKEVEPWIQPPTQLCPFREWVAASDGRTGLAIAVKGIYDYEAVINPLNNQPDLSLTLLRGFEYMSRINTLQRAGDAASAHHTPGAQCLGPQEIEWAYIPYRATPANIAPFIPTAQGFLFPVVTHAVRAEQAPARLDAAMQPFTFLNADVQFSAFKRAYDGNGYILRFFENQGKPVEAKLRLEGFSRVYLSNMNEEILEEIPLTSQTVSVPVGPYKVITLLLTTDF
jgi:mannosylglycerate hydrolase